MRSLPLVGTLACLMLVTACSSPVKHQDGAAAPAGSAAPTSAAPTATTSAPTPPTPPASPASPTGDVPAKTLVLGPVGFGALKLGMSQQQATATAAVTAFKNFGDACKAANLRQAPSGGGVYFSRKLGITAIGAFGSVHTPEGVRLGTSSADLLRIYPVWAAVGEDEGEVNGRGYVPVTGNAKANYRIVVSKGKVTELSLQSAKQDCYE